jgi:hypothetical protein
MQTFLPYNNFAKTASVLDQKRLGKQRVEAYQILNILEGRNPDSKWKNHVAVRMWKGYEKCLRLYYNSMLNEWEQVRGNNNNMPYLTVKSGTIIPPWLSDPRLPLSHRGNLLRKDPEYYGQFGWDDADPHAPYWWPVTPKTPELAKWMIQYWGNFH